MHSPTLLTQWSRLWMRPCPWTPPACEATAGWRSWPTCAGERGCKVGGRKALLLHCLQAVPLILMRNATCCRAAGLQLSLAAAAGESWRELPLPDLVQQLNSCAVHAQPGEGGCTLGLLTCTAVMPCVDRAPPAAAHRCAVCRRS